MPFGITTLSASSGASEDTIVLNWIAPGDDGLRGEITGGKYWIKYSQDISDSWGDMLYQIVWSTDTLQGSVETKVITGLLSSVTYYFYIRTQAF